MKPSVDIDNWHLYLTFIFHIHRSSLDSYSCMNIVVANGHVQNPMLWYASLPPWECSRFSCSRWCCPSRCFAVLSLSFMASCTSTYLTVCRWEMRIDAISERGRGILVVVKEGINRWESWLSHSKRRNSIRFSSMLHNNAWLEQLLDQWNKQDAST